MMQAEIVAVSSEVTSAGPKPGDGLTPPVSRPTNATIGASR
jgi:hypothetical protein